MIQVQDLKESGKFKLFHSFSVDDTMKFLSEEFSGKKTSSGEKPKAGIGVFLFSLLIGAAAGFLGVSFLDDISGLLYAVLFFYLMILPIHEWIHGLTYKAMGAESVGYGFSLKAGMVYAYAQNFVCNMSQLLRVAIMPFAILTPLMIVGIFLLPAYKIHLSVCLLIHTMACIGDFGLIYVARKYKDQNMYTYDDIKNERMTYYYQKVSN
jgi:cellulose synthase/poly-beta-1,6-N-acetylglucosamine synthase-like glycosyltransferase